MGNEINEIKNILRIYCITTNINCRAIEINNMEYIECDEFNLKPNFCKLIHKHNDCQEDCNNSYLYGGRQAEKLGEEYIYYCPYGLVNWAVPLVKNNRMEYIIVGGPTLIHPVDELLLEDIFKQNSLLKNEKKLITTKLEKIPYADPVRTRYLAELLMRLTNSIQDYSLLEEKRNKHSVNTYLAESIHEFKKSSLEQSKRYPLDKEKELISKVKSGDKEGARKLLNKLLGHIYFNNKEKDFAIVKAKTIELMAVLSRAAIEVGADLEIIFGLEYMLYEQLNQVENINDLSEWLSKILDRFIESTFIISKAKNKDTIYKAVNYIRNNYYDKNINLNDVADEVNLSVSYFSKLFKEELGFSYSEYLNKVRIAASKELLKNNVSISEVAQTVGFNDQSYFSKVFKKIERVSPGRYK